jgi:hypothetical protein
MGTAAPTFSAHKIELGGLKTMPVDGGRRSVAGSALNGITDPNRTAFQSLSLEMPKGLALRRSFVRLSMVFEDGWHASKSVEGWRDE